MQSILNWFADFFTNPFLITALSSWMIAQVLKLIIHWVINRKFDITRLFGDGGMPSGHSATVSSLALLCGLRFGAGSVEFAIAMIVAVVVCHDAMGVRRETGKHSVVINDIIKALEVLTTDKLPDEKLKEFVGHSPVQVYAGVLLGFINAIVMNSVFF